MRLTLLTFAAALAVVLGAAASAPLPEGCIEVQHVLIAFDGSAMTRPIGRTKDEAKQLADDVLRRAKAGESFDKLVKEYSDDFVPGKPKASGKYFMCEAENTPNAPKGAYARSNMVPGFGDVSYSLKPGEIGMSEFDTERSPFGWHIIKRLR